MKKLLKWIGRDGLLHIETSTLAYLLLAPYMPSWLAALIALALGIAWELVGKKFGGVASWHDVICDIAGVALGVLMTLLKYLS